MQIKDSNSIGLKESFSQTDTFAYIILLPDLNL